MKKSDNKIIDYSGNNFKEFLDHLYNFYQQEDEDLLFRELNNREFDDQNIFINLFLSKKKEIGFKLKKHAFVKKSILEFVERWIEFYRKNIDHNILEVYSIVYPPYGVNDNYDIDLSMRERLLIYLMYQYDIYEKVQKQVDDFFYGTENFINLDIYKNIKELHLICDFFKTLGQEVVTKNKKFYVFVKHISFRDFNCLMIIYYNKLQKLNKLIEYGYDVPFDIELEINNYEIFYSNNFEKIVEGYILMPNESEEKYIRKKFDKMFNALNELLECGFKEDKIHIYKYRIIQLAEQYNIDIPENFKL